MPKDPGEPTLSRRLASALPAELRGKQREDQHGGHVPILDDGELLQQLFAYFGSIPFVGRGKPAGAAPPEKRHSLS